MKWETVVRVEVPTDVKLALFEEILIQGEMGRVSKVDLIKLVRSMMQERFPNTSYGLKDAKDLIDSVHGFIMDYAYLWRPVQ